MPAITLPINPAPPITGRLRHAYPLSILATDDAYLPWFHSSFIQLFCPKVRGFAESHVDFFYPPHYPSMPLLRVERFDRGLVEERLRRDLGHFITQCLGRGRYISLYVDEYHIPGTASYREHHFVHRLLIYGYASDGCDDGTSAGREGGGARAAVLGFRASGRYEAYEIGLENLWRALDSRFLRQEAEAASVGLRPPGLGRAGEIWLAHRTPWNPCQFDLELVMEQLEDYLLARDPTTRVRLLDTGYYGQESSGWQVYESIIRRLAHSMANPGYFDLLSMHVLWEHKKCMLARIAYLEQLGYLEARQRLRPRSEKVREGAAILRMMMLRSSLSGDLSLVERMVPRLEAMARDERLVLEEVLGTLKVKAVGADQTLRTARVGPR